MVQLSRLFEETKADTSVTTEVHIEFKQVFLFQTFSQEHLAARSAKDQSASCIASVCRASKIAEEVQVSQV